MKYKVIGQTIEFLNRHSVKNRQRGRRPSQRLAVIIRVSNLTLSDIARVYAVNRSTTQLRETVNANCVVARSTTQLRETVNANCVVARANLSHVLANRDNSPAYIKAIESAWKISISEIRRILAEDKTNTFTKQELEQFMLDYAESHFPDYARKFLAAKNQNLFGEAA